MVLKGVVQLLPLFLLMLLGIVLGKKGLVTEDFRRQIGRASCRERVCQYV